MKLNLSKSREELRPIITDIIDDAMRHWRWGNWDIFKRSSLDKMITKIFAVIKKNAEE